MITTRKRLLSLLLAITMVITLLPHVSFAAEKEQKQGTEVTTDASKDKNDSKDTKEQKDPVKGLEEGPTGLSV